MAYLTCHPAPMPPSRDPARFGMEFEEIRIAVANRDRSLSGWLCRGDPGRVVLLGHGLAMEKSRSLRYAQFLHRAGYTVLLFDFRNHGDSFRDRGLTRFNRRFVDDVAAAVRHVRGIDEFGSARLALYGFSLSSFAMLYSLTRTAVPIDAVVCDSGPSAEPSIVARNLLHLGLLPLPPNLRAAPARTAVMRLYQLFIGMTMGWPRDWPPSLARPGQACPPMLFVTGTADDLVPAEQVRLLAGSYPRAEVWEVPGAGHLRAIAMDRERYTGTVLDFLHRVLDQPTGGR
jgi:pimeloyl-ACP methyl ester carboxylesterase